MFILRNIYRCKSTIFRSPCYSLQRVQIVNDSSRKLTPSHTTRDSFMNKSFAFSRDVRSKIIFAFCFFLALTETP